MVSEDAFRLRAGRLHHRYLNREVSVPDAEGDQRSGHLQAFKLGNPAAAEDFFDNYEVSIWIDDREIAVAGDAFVTFIDGLGEEPLP